MVYSPAPRLVAGINELDKVLSGEWGMRKHPPTRSRGPVIRQQHTELQQQYTTPPRTASTNQGLSSALSPGLITHLPTASLATASSFEVAGAGQAPYLSPRKRMPECVLIAPKPYQATP